MSVLVFASSPMGMIPRSSSPSRSSSVGRSPHDEILERSSVSSFLLEIERTEFGVTR
jgi:hypothetical protein